MPTILLRSLLAAEGAGAPPNAREIAARVFLCIAVVVVVGRVISALFRRIGQPAVLGEILAGIALGPSLLGLFGKDLPQKLFPTEVRPFLRVVSELGLVIFMFIVGLEVDPAVIKRSGRKAVVISVTSVIVPFALGTLLLSSYLYRDHKVVTVAGAGGGTFPVKRLAFALFIGVSMCVTAFPILARILTERRMFRIPLGMLLISAAAADDIIAFSLLTVTLSVSGSADGLPIWQVVVYLVLFLVVLFGPVRRLLDRYVIDPYRRDHKIKPDQLAILLGCVVACAYISFKIVDTSLIGPFLLGASLPRKDVGHFFEEVMERVEGVSVTLLLPVFFVVTGLGVDIRGLGVKGIVPALIILVVACLGKFAGAGFAAKMQGISTRQSLAIGTMMNTRGLAELVILGIARDRRILDEQLYTMLVIMTVVTTVMAGPLLKLIYPDKWLEHDIAEAERLRAGLAKGFNATIVVADPATTMRVADLAIAAIGDTRPAGVSLTHLPPAGRGPGELGAGIAGGLAQLASSFGALAAVRKRIEDQGITCTVTSRLSADPLTDILEQSRNGNPNVVFVEWGAGTRAAAERLMADPPAIVAVVSGPPAAPGAPVLGGGTGTDHDAALELAARLARGSGVGVRMSESGRGRSSGRARRELEDAGIAVTGYDADLLERSLAASDRDLLILTGTGDTGKLEPQLLAAAEAGSAPLIIVRGPAREHTPLVDRLGIAPVIGKPLGASPLNRDLAPSGE